MVDINKPQVSIVTPVYNRGKFLSEMIESVLAQTYTTWELLLVDDGSTDKSWEIMQEYAANDNRVKILKRPAKRLKGANAARNFGFENAKGSFINWFDSDDKMHPEFIERKVKVLERKHDLDIVLSKTIKIFKTEEVKENRTFISSSLLEDFITRKISWYLFDAMIRKTSLEGFSLFDEKLLGGQDRDFFIRLLTELSPKIEVIDFYATYYKIHSQSISEEIYRKGNVKMQFSHYRSLINQIKVLKKNNKLDNTLKKHYACEISKRLPAVIKTHSNVRGYFCWLFYLSGINLPSVKIWVKVMVSYFSFTFFGKGERFLK